MVNSNPMSHIKISPEEWVLMLESVAESYRLSNTSSQARQYFYLNGTDKINVYSSHKTAKKNGYFQKLKFSSLVELTQLMIESLDEDAKQAAVKNLRTLGIHKSCKFEKKHPVLKIFSKTHLTIDESLSLGSELSVFADSMITPSKLAQVIDAATEAKEIIRSKSGDRGVYFFMSPLGKPVGVKMEFNPIQHVVADRYFRLMGFETPKYCAFSMESVEGKKVFEKLKTLGNAYFDEQLKSPTTNLSADTMKSRKKTLNTHLKECDYFLSMEYLRAVPFRNMRCGDAIRDFQDPDFLRELGEVIFLDAVIHHTDRINSCNFGNIMRRNNRDVLPGEKKIASIDHDYKLNDENVQQCKDNITNLLKGDRAEALVDKFVHTFPTDVSDQLQIEKMMPEIKIGMNRAAKTFVEKFSEEATVLEMLNVPTLENRPKPDFRIFMSLVKHTKELLT